MNIQKLNRIISNKITAPTPLNFNPALWYNTQNRVDDGSGYTQQYLDISGNNRHSAVQTGTSKPLFSANEQNAIGCDIYDGSNDYINSPDFSLSQPYTVYIVCKTLTTSPGADRAIMGGLTASNFTGIRQDTAFRIYAGANQTFGTVVPNTVQVLNVEFNTTNSKFFLSDFAAGGNNVGAFNPAGISVGRYGNTNTTCLNVKFFEIIVYNGIHTDYERNVIYNWLSVKYNLEFKVKLSNIFDGIFKNSVQMADMGSYKIRNPFSEYKFLYSENAIYIKANPTLYSNFPNWSYVTIYINGSYHSRVQITSNSTVYKIPLPKGNKVVSLVESTTTKPSTDILGTYITEIYGVGNKYTKIPDTDDEKIVFITDSIGNGANSTRPALDGFTRLFNTEDGKNVAVLGYGYAKLVDFGGDSTKIADTVTKLQTLFANATTKKLVITLGTNDNSASVPSSTFISNYSDLIDAVHLADSDIQFFCQSPFTRPGDQTLLNQYNSGMNTMCSTRVWSSYIDGRTLVTLSDLDVDNLHLTDSGHINAWTALRTYIS